MFRVFHQELAEVQVLPMVPQPAPRCSSYQMSDLEKVTSTLSTMSSSPLQTEGTNF